MSIIVLFRVRRTLQKTLPHRVTNTPPKSTAVPVGVVLFALCLSMGLAIPFMYFTISKQTKMPYLSNISLRLYILSYMHYLLSLRVIMRTYEEVEQARSAIDRNVIDMEEVYPQKKEIAPETPDTLGRYGRKESFNSVYNGRISPEALISDSTHPVPPWHRKF